MMRLTRIAAFAAVMTITLAACSGSKSSNTTTPYGTGDPSLGAANPMGGPIDPFLTDGQAVTNAIDAVAKHAAKPLRIMMINATAGGGLTVDVRDPHKRGNLDRYQVASTGTVFGPIPMQLVVEGRPVTADEIDRQAFDSKAIDFTRLAQVERDALTQAKIPDARVAVWSVAGIRPNDHRSIILEYSSGRAAVILDPQLNIVRIARYGH